MRVKLVLALICLLLIVQTVSAENRVTNGDFETRDLTGWAVSTDNGNVEVKGEAAHSGLYGCKLYAQRWGWAKIAQSVDLTGVDTITFYFKADGYNPQYGSFEVYIGGDKVYSHGGASDWRYVEIDASEYSGNITLWFRASGGDVNYIGDYYVYLDDIVAEASIEVHNVTFQFYDVVNQQYLANVTLYYSLDGENYTAVFSSGDNITVPSGTNLTNLQCAQVWLSERIRGGTAVGELDNNK